jgi:hypothetical protein
MLQKDRHLPTALAEIELQKSMSKAYREHLDSVRRHRIAEEAVTDEMVTAEMERLGVSGVIAMVRTHVRMVGEYADGLKETDR